MSERPKISLITITRDEEALIGECLKSAWFCDEKIIIDSFSTDKTVEIARGLGADVVQHEFTNYVNAEADGARSRDRRLGAADGCRRAGDARPRRGDPARRVVAGRRRRLQDSAHPVSPGPLLLARDLSRHSRAPVPPRARAYWRARSARQSRGRGTGRAAGRSRFCISVIAISPITSRRSTGSARALRWSRSRTRSRRSR